MAFVIVIAYGLLPVACGLLLLAQGHCQSSFAVCSGGCGCCYGAAEPGTAKGIEARGRSRQRKYETNINHRQTIGKPQGNIIPYIGSYLIPILVNINFINSNFNFIWIGNPNNCLRLNRRPQAFFSWGGGIRIFQKMVAWVNPSHVYG